MTLFEVIVLTNASQGGVKLIAFNNALQKQGVKYLWWDVKKMFNRQ